MDSREIQEKDPTEFHSQLGRGRQRELTRIVLFGLQADKAVFLLDRIILF